MGRPVKTVAGIDDYITIADARKIYPHITAPMMFAWIKTGVLRAHRPRITRDKLMGAYVHKADLEACAAKEADLVWYREIARDEVQKEVGKHARSLLAKFPLDPNKKLLGVPEIADMLSVDRKIVYEWIKNGLLPHVVLPGYNSYRVHPQHLADFIGLPLEMVL